MISAFEARERLESGERVDVKFWKKNGEIVDAKQVICIRSHFQTNTFKVKFPNGQIRDFKAVLLHELNGEEVPL